MMFIQTLVTDGSPFGLTPIGAMSIHNLGGERDKDGKVEYEWAITEQRRKLGGLPTYTTHGKVMHNPDNGQYRLVKLVIEAYEECA